MFLEPVIFEYNEFLLNAILSLPVVFKNNPLSPELILLEPVVLDSREPLPCAML